MAGVFTVDRHVDNGAYVVALYVLYVKRVHKFIVASCNSVAVNQSLNALPADFFYVRDTAAVNLFAVSCLQALAYRVRAGALGQRRIFYERCVVIWAVMNAIDLEDTFC